MKSIRLLVMMLLVASSGFYSVHGAAAAKGPFDYEDVTLRELLGDVAPGKLPATFKRRVMMLLHPDKQVLVGEWILKNSGLCYSDEVLYGHLNELFKWAQNCRLDQHTLDSKVKLPCFAIGIIKERNEAAKNKEEQTEELKKQAQAAGEGNFKPSKAKAQSPIRTTFAEPAQPAAAPAPEAASAAPKTSKKTVYEKLCERVESGKISTIDQLGQAIANNTLSAQQETGLRDFFATIVAKTARDQEIKQKARADFTKLPLSQQEKIWADPSELATEDEQEFFERIRSALTSEEIRDLFIENAAYFCIEIEKAVSSGLVKRVEQLHLVPSFDPALSEEMKDSFKGYLLKGLEARMNGVSVLLAAIDSGEIKSVDDLELSPEYDFIGAAQKRQMKQALADKKSVGRFTETTSGRKTEAAPAETAPKVAPAVAPKPVKKTAQESAKPAQPAAAEAADDTPRVVPVNSQGSPRPTPKPRPKSTYGAPASATPQGSPKPTPRPRPKSTYDEAAAAASQDNGDEVLYTQPVFAPKPSGTVRGGGPVSPVHATIDPALTAAQAARIPSLHSDDGDGYGSESDLYEAPHGQELRKQG